MLPVPIMKTRWVDVTNPVSSPRFDKIRQAAMRAANGPGWSVKVIKLSKHLVLLDATMHDGKLSQIKVGLFKDHETLAQLSAVEGVPRRVKALYRKENMLARERSGYDLMTSELLAANKAYVAFRRNRPIYVTDVDILKSRKRYPLAHD